MARWGGSWFQEGIAAFASEILGVWKDLGEQKDFRQVLFALSSFLACFLICFLKGLLCDGLHLTSNPLHSVTASHVQGAFIYFLTLPSLAVLLWSRQKGRLAVYQRPWLF